MSQDIITAQYQDPNLESIRTTVNKKKDSIPFLLLPVKVETRFMKVDKEVILEKPVENKQIYEDLIQIDYLLKQPVSGLNYQELVKHATEIDEGLKGTLYNLENITSVPKNELWWLFDQSESIEKNYQQFSVSLLKYPAPTPAEKSNIKNLNSNISSDVTELSNAINGIFFSKETKYTEASEIIDSLNKIEDELDKVLKKDFSTTEKDEKKKIYTDLSKKLTSIQLETEMVKYRYNLNMVATSTQINRIKELTTTIEEKINNVPVSLNKLKSNYKRAEYVTRFGDINAKQLTKLKNTINSIVLPKLEFNHELRIIEAKEVLYDINRILYDIKWINDQNLSTYNDVRAYRVRIYEQLIVLRASVHEVIESSEAEMDKISEAWEKVDQELEKFIGKLKLFKGKTRYEKAGTSRAITHINEEYRKDLAILKKEKRPEALRLTNQNFTASALAYKKALQEFTSLEKRFANHVFNRTSEPASNLLNSLISLNSEFKVLARNISVIPWEYFWKLKNSLNNIWASYKKIFYTSAPTTTKNPLILEAEKALAEIEKTLNNQRTDVVDFKDPFYDEYRKPLVCTYKTITVDELWVRIYPDDIAIHSHEEALTTQEVEAGKAYWNEIWAASGDYDIMLGAWRAIVAGYGSQRAAWIVKSLDPSTVEASSSILERQPSLKMTGIIKYLEEIYKELSNISKQDTFYNSLSSINIGKISQTLAQVEEYLSTIKKENSLLVVKANRLLRKIHAILSTLTKGRATLTSSEINKLGDKVSKFDTSVRSFSNIITSTQKVNPITTKEILSQQEEELVFPEVKTKEESWTQAPQTKVMPCQFVAITMNNNQFVHIKTGNKLPAVPLKVGLDPEKFESTTFSYDSEGNLIVDEDIKWMTDYGEAVKKGMAISIELTEDQVENGFEKILVLGIKDTGEKKGQELIEELLANHHFIDEGMDILSIGTPTNNTEEGKSGFSSFNEDEAASFEIERNNEQPTEEPPSDYKTDGQRLAEGLGINKEIFRNIQNFSATGISDAITMNKALWPSTIGGFMSDILDSVFTLDNIKRARSFFTNNVTGRGILPSIRVGTQPYGILPTTAFSRFFVTNGDDTLPLLTKEQFNNPSAIENDLQLRFDIRLKEMLFTLNALWTDVMKTYVKHAYNTDPNNPQQHFMDMLGLHASSVENYFRYSVNVVRRRPTPNDVDFSINFNSGDYFGPDYLYQLVSSVMNPGYFYTSDEFYDETHTFIDPSEKDRYRDERIKGQLYGSRLYKSRNLSEQSILTGKLIDSQELSSSLTLEKLELDGSSKTYIEWLLNKSLWNILNYNDFETLPSKSLLFMFLRQALMTEYRDTALNIMQYENCTDEKTRRLMGSAQYYHTYSPYWGNFTYATKWTYLFNHFEKLNGLLGFIMENSNSFYNYMKTKSMASYLISPGTNNTFKNYNGSSNHLTLMESLEEVKSAISRLNSIPTASLAHLLAEHIDLCTYRLDAWMLGLVNKRLQKQRTNTAQGVYIGAYGWLENLKHGGIRKEASDIPEGLCKENNDPVYTDEDNGGFIHAPSIGHAITAAVLRSVFISNQATSDLENQFAINLSSERVRLAMNLLDGVRNGQEVGAVLGYQFERGLHERYTHLGLELDQYIYSFREKYPLVTNEDGTISITNQSTNVVHGLDLLEEAESIIESLDYDKNMSMYEVLKANVETHWPWLHNLIENDQELDAVLKEIDRLANTFDALGDMVLSESVYQVVKGNHKRAAVVVSSLSEGKNPPEIQIIDTPRTGIYVTHKVLLHVEPISGKNISISDNPDEPTLNQRVEDANALPTGWDFALTPKAFAEPSLNKWLGEMIGNPINIRCRVSYTIDEATTSLEVSLKDLNIHPLDFISIMGDGFSKGGSEINNRVAYFVRSSADPMLESDVELLIDYTGRDGAWGNEVKTFYEMAPYINYLSEIVTNSNPVTAEDLIKPGEEVEDEQDMQMQDSEELITRINDALTRLQNAYTNLTTYYTNETDIDNLDSVSFTEDQVDTLRGYMYKFSFFGIPGTIPEAVVEFSDEIGRELVKKSQTIYKVAGDKVNKAQEFIANAQTATLPNQVISAYTDAAKAIFGKSFIICPQYKLRNPDEITTLVNFDESKGILRGAGKFALDEWVQGVSQVRKRIGNLQNTSILASAFEVQFPGMQPIQMPFTENEDPAINDYWLGIEYPETYLPTEDKLSIMLLDPNKLTSNPDQNKAGILVDQWVEIIPNKIETTGVTFNYDQPDATPPQNLLLAVTPKETGKWSWDNLVYTLIDTLDLAKIRAVEPEHLDKTVLSQVLPSIMGEVVPPDLQNTEGDESASNPLGVQVVMDFGINNETVEE